MPEAWHSKLRGAQARSLAWKGNPILAFTSQDSPFWHVSSPFWHVCCASAVVFATSLHHTYDAKGDASTDLIHKKLMRSQLADANIQSALFLHPYASLALCETRLDPPPLDSFSQSCTHALSPPLCPFLLTICKITFLLTLL